MRAPGWWTRLRARLHVCARPAGDVGDVFVCGTCGRAWRAVRWEHEEDIVYVDNASAADIGSDYLVWEEMRADE